MSKATLILVGILTAAALAVVTHMNVTLRDQMQADEAEIALLRTQNLYTHELFVYDSIAHSLEGKTVPLHMILGGKRTKSSMTSSLGEDVSIILLEGRKPCTPCFEMALGRLSEMKDTVLDASIPPLLVISHRPEYWSRRVKKCLANRKRILFDSIGSIHKNLGIPEPVTVSMLVDRHGTIIVSHVVHSRYPQLFNRFLLRSERIAAVILARKSRDTKLRSHP